MKKIVVVAVAAVMLVVAAGGAWWAFAADGESQTSGRCGQVAYSLSADEEDGALEVSFELQSAAPGEQWQLQLAQGGTQIFEGARTTDEDGEIDMDVAVDENDGSRFEVTATPQQGEPCTATLER